MTKASKKTVLSHLDHLKTAEEGIHTAFGYDHQWTDLKIDDCTNVAWCVSAHGDRLFFTHGHFTKEKIEAGDDIFSVEIMGDKSWTCDGFVMYPVDTNTDGNKYLSIYDASKRCEDPKLIELVEETW